MPRLNQIALMAIAKVCHDANRAYCATLGDYSQRLWEDCPQWQKDSAVAGVKLHAENEYSSAQDSHEAWYQHKLADGWIYGPMKNEEKKEHPCMVSFYELPPEQQAKDFLFHGIVHALVHRSPLFNE